MASSSSRAKVSKTRLQAATEKRKAEEQLNHETELNRQRKLLAPDDVIGPRDILVTSNHLPKIKLEEDVGCSLIIKQKTLEAESIVIEPCDSFVNSDLLDIKPEVDNSLVVKVEETLELEATVKEEFSEQIEPVEVQGNPDNETDSNPGFSATLEQNDSLPDFIPESVQKNLSRNAQLARRNEMEIRVLMELIERLKLRLSILVPNPLTTKLKGIDSDGFVENLDDSTLNPSFDIAQAVEILTDDEQNKNVKIFLLSHQILQLQCKIFQSLPDPHLKKVLPVLYPEFQLNDTYDYRSSCIDWQTVAKKFVADIGQIPTWKVPPSQILAKTYKFTDLSELDNYIKKRNHSMSCSTVWLDNISIENKASLKSVRIFFAVFGNKIKYVKIRQCIDIESQYMDSKTELLMDFIKFCLERLPNLACFTLVLSRGTDKSEGSNYWKNVLIKKTPINDYWQGYTFPKLAHLESVVIEFEGISTFVFLKFLVSSLIGSYSNQVKQLSILESGDSLWFIGSLVSSSLTQLIIYQNLLGKIVLESKNLEKCTILDHTIDLKHDDVIIIKTMFPKLKCLGFKFVKWRSDFHDSLWTTSTPKLFNVLTLELEFCRSVTFTLLRCFPDLRYLKLIGVRTQQLSDNPHKTTVLGIWKLFQNENLYESHQFWEQFPNISLVTVELSESDESNIPQPEKSLAPKLCMYTREGYLQSRGNKFHDSK